MTDHVDARRDAADAADRAAVTVTSVDTPDELDVLRSTMERVWGPEIVPPRNLLRGLALGGACLQVAWRAESPVGFALGWLGWRDGLHFHSHQVGVIGDVRGGGVGLALKLAQRALCLDNGITEMRWTFDPLLATNARFNLVRLGARVVDFHPHCYGDRRDAFNTGERTDRVEVSWQLDRPVAGAMVEPVDTDELIAIPREYLRLRDVEPDAAREVRRVVGQSFAALFATGGHVRGLCEAGYVVQSGARS